jgi:hypothetical protein
MAGGCESVGGKDGRPSTANTDGKTTKRQPRPGSSIETNKQRVSLGKLTSSVLVKGDKKELVEGW